MTDASDYDPVECPVSDCTYRDAMRSVAAHVSGTDGDGHSWDRLGYDGARDFVETEKRRQRQATRSSSTRGATGSGSDSGFSTASSHRDATDDAASNGDATSTNDDTATTSETATASETDDPEEPFELGFEREALVLLQLASEYDLSSLDDLGTYQLADLYSLLADLKNTAEDARAEVRDALLDQVHRDETIAADLGAVSRRSYTYRQIRDEATVHRALDAADVDPESVRSFDKGRLKDAIEESSLDEDAVFDVEERAQIRIKDSNDNRRREQFDRLDEEVRSLVDDER